VYTGYAHGDERIVLSMQQSAGIAAVRGTDRMQ
jgi:hypothetical protein